ncbi:MAG: hypothetical protein ACI9F9_003263 [Candidatus Paceibacteria bacterium]|jgi:hypothetical protein
MKIGGIGLAGAWLRAPSTAAFIGPERHLDGYLPLIFPVGEPYSLRKEQMTKVLLEGAGPLTVCGQDS